MKKFVFTILAGGAALALAACDNSADEAAVTDDAMVTDTMPAPSDSMTDTTTGSTMTEPTEDLDGGNMDADDRVTVDETGVQADINSGDTSVNANVSEDPSLTVQD